MRYDYNADRQLDLVTVDGEPTPIADLIYNASTGQLETIAMPDGDISLGYSPTTGQLTSLSSPDGVDLLQTFDGFLLQALQWTDQGAGSVAWHRDGRFLVQTEMVRGGATAPTPITDSATCDGTPGCVSYEYDADGITTRAGEMSLSPDDTTGQIKTKTIGVIRETLTYNAHGELARQLVENTSTLEVLYDVVYDDGGTGTLGARDALGRIVKRTERVLGEEHTFEYGYNLDGRPWLETVLRDEVPVSQYSYDGNGNRTAAMLDRTWAGGGVTELSASDIVTDAEDRLISYGGVTFEYDALGRVVQKTEGSAVTTYTWDSLGALKSVDLPDGRLIEYLTDGIGRRVAKKVDGVVVKRWIYRDTLRPIAELDGAGNVVARFVYGEGYAPEYMEKGGQRYRLVTDQLGSVRLVVEELAGAVAQRIEYEEFGNVLSDSAEGFQPFGCAGGLYDADTSLVRFGAREYDPALGRWTGRESLRFSVDRNF